MRNIILFFLMISIDISSNAQVRIWAATEYPKAVTDSVMHSASGVSGAGKSITGNFFGGTGFEPCHLCRWARIIMYPLVLISFIALLRKDTKIAYTILPISFI